MPLKFALIAAACENMGIGINGDLPWRLKSEMAFFTKMTSETRDDQKRNVVLMGRRTWDCIPVKFKPLQGRINFVLSRSSLELGNYKDSYAFKSLKEAVEALQSEEFRGAYENVWVIGGSSIYEETMKSEYFHRLYLTRILKHFECDTFFPKIDDKLVEVKDPEVPDGIQKENGIEFVYKVYENPEFKK